MDIKDDKALLDNKKSQSENNINNEWDWRDDLIDEMEFWYSFGALYLDRKYTGLDTDIYLCQNVDYLIETGKFKVFFKVSYNHQYGSEGYGIIENGDFYMKDFDICNIKDIDIDNIIKFIYNNNFYLQLLVFNSKAVDYNNFIKSNSFITDEKILYSQLENSEKILSNCDLKHIQIMQIRKWWDILYRKEEGIDAEFCHNLIKRLHKLYYKQFGFGHFMFAFNSWISDKYDKDYFSISDIEMPNVIETFKKYSR